MIIDLRLQNFRSYTDESFEFSPGVNIIVGPNASGKTNLLEAVLVLARGSSYRVKDTELIQFTAPWARLDAHMEHGGERIMKIVSEPTPGKRFDIDGKLYKRLTLAHTLPVVLFEPNHLQLLSGSPEGRRTYLDDLLEQTVSGYGTLRRQYKRTLAQRNALLKQSPHTVTQLFPWNVRLSELAGQIVRQRCRLVAQMAEQLPSLYESLSHTATKTALSYKAQWSAESYESNLLKKLEMSTELDAVRGFTSAGPHREDITVLFNTHPADETASRGEIRTLVLALKILELEIIRAARESTPLLLLDDVFSELDGSRRRALTTYLQQYQTFITTTDADVVLQNFTESA
ncbi:MAG TPA: DNA replication and repair protein RecF, partial [Candidatus Saccharimonadales bacterium]|nr:DNA replication and repair protein RecF [Candidatus Saccharimonadales bacterium]